MVRPALVKARFGDGKRLIGLMAIMHRPFYYLVWIDSTWDLDGAEIRDALDEIWEAIGDEFGSRPYDAPDYQWPEEDSNCGCSWFKADAFDVLPPRMRRRYLRNSTSTATGRS